MSATRKPPPSRRSSHHHNATPSKALGNAAGRNTINRSPSPRLPKYDEDPRVATLHPLDPLLEHIDPRPNVQRLFARFNRQYFYGLLDVVSVSYGNANMTDSAGLTRFTGADDDIVICLSRPLLDKAKRSDIVETLLHEMIHAYLMVIGREDYEEHGRRFMAELDRLNKALGVRMECEHDIDTDTEALKPYLWRCNGRCEAEQRRANKREPGESHHEPGCDGEFVLQDNARTPRK